MVDWGGVEWVLSGVICDGSGEVWSQHTVATVHLNVNSSLWEFVWGAIVTIGVHFHLQSGIV